MKKLGLLLSLLLVGTVAVQAQSESGFGVRGGANLFTWGGSDINSNDYNNRVGFHAGIYGNGFISDRFSIEPGLYYSVKGTQNDDMVNSRAVLDYVELPVLFRIYATEGVNLFFGPQASVLVGSTFEADALGNTYGWDTDNINDFDAAVVVGIGYNLPKGFNLQASYDFGVNPVFKDSDAAVYNRGFKLSAGISF